MRNLRGPQKVDLAGMVTSETIWSKASRIILAVLLAFLLIPPFSLSSSVAFADSEDASAAQPEALQAGEDTSLQGDEAEGGIIQDLQDAEALSGSKEAASPDEEGGMQTHEQVGVGSSVQGNISLHQWAGNDPQTNDPVDDWSFAEGLNKVCIDSTKNNGLAYAAMYFDPIIRDGQTGIQDDWDSISPDEKYTLETVRFSSEDAEVLSLERVESIGASALLVLHAEKPGTVEVHIGYLYHHEATDVTYEGELGFTASVVPGPNKAVSVSTPSKSVDIWAWEYTSSDTSAYYPYYYEYPCTDGFSASNQWYMLRYETDVAEAPATARFEELFDISIEDEEVISNVYNPRRVYEGDANVVTGMDSHTYDLEFSSKAPGMTDVTISLKDDPTKSVTISVTVHGDPITLDVPDHDMQVGSTQHIYIEGYGTSSSDSSPIALPEKARYLNYAADWARPYVKSITSSDTAVMEIKSIENPSFDQRFAPFDIIPLSVGTAQLTLTDCYGTAYTCTVTVKPNPEEEKDPALIINSVKVKNGSSDISKGALKISTRDVRGTQLTAEVDPSSPDVKVAWASSDESIATVDENGVVRPVRESVDALGKPVDCRITATANGQKSEYCTIVVEAANGLCAAPADSPLGAATVKLPNAMPEDLLNELDSVALSISAIPPVSQGAIDSAVGDLGQSGARVHAVYDIHLSNKSDGTEHAWNQPDHPITIQIPMDANMREMYRHGTLSFYHIDPATGIRTKMRTWVDSTLDHIFFETTHFSPFALVLEPNADGTTSAGTGTGTDDNVGNGGAGDTGGAGNGAGNSGSDQLQPSGDPQRNGQSVGNGPSNAPLAQTGDVANKLLGAALLCVSASLLLAVFSRRKKVEAAAKSK